MEQIKKSVNGFLILGWIIYIVFPIVGLYLIYDEYQAGKNCGRYQLERNHPYGDPPWVSCTDGVRVWAVDRKR